jgi:hypothetical protein
MNQGAKRMRKVLGILLGIVCCAAVGFGQTAEELVAKNTQGKGGLEKIKAVKSFRAVGKLEQGGFRANIDWEAKRPEMYRQNVTFQGMTEIEAYDGSAGWTISPFEGKKDPTLVGEDELRNLVEDADFDGPLIDAQEKGNKIEYLGKDIVDGDDAYRLKVTLKNGDILYYYLDPATFLEFRTEKQQFIRGNVRETVTELGSYKPVNGVLYAFSFESGSKRSTNRTKINLDKIEANIALDDAYFQMPGGAAAKPAAEQTPKAPAAKPTAQPKKK